MSKDIDLIIFSKKPNCKEAKTRLRKSIDSDIVNKLHNAMLIDTINLVKQAKVKYKSIYWYPTKNSAYQKNKSLT